jgi:hypothetical protein
VSLGVRDRTAAQIEERLEDIHILLLNRLVVGGVGGVEEVDDTLTRLASESMSSDRNILSLLQSL